MMGHLTGFLVYMLAMLGVIFIAFLVVKKSFTFKSGKQKKSFLQVESSLSLEPRKNLYIVKAGNERFLISTGFEGCQFMTKIDDGNIPNKFESSDVYLDEMKESKPNSQIKIPAINLGGFR